MVAVRVLSLILVQIPGRMDMDTEAMTAGVMVAEGTEVIKKKLLATETQRAQREMGD